MSGHPSLESLAAFVLGEETGAPGAETAAHLAVCARCRRTADRLERLAGLISRAVETAPSERVLARAVALASDRTFIEAELLEDTEIIAGVRAGDAEGRILVYRAGEMDLHLQLIRGRSRNRVSFLGQLHGSGESGVPGAKIRVLSGHRVLAEASSDEIGEFVIETRLELPAIFEIETPDGTLRTPPIR